MSKVKNKGRSKDRLMLCLLVLMATLVSGCARYQAQPLEDFTEECSQKTES